jgi:hypothetical protein
MLEMVLAFAAVTASLAELAVRDGCCCRCRICVTRLILSSFS